jgi:hypothetical protein
MRRRAGVDDRAASLGDHERATEGLDEPEGAGTGRFVLGDAVRRRKDAGPDGAIRLSSVAIAWRRASSSPVVSRTTPRGLPCSPAGLVKTRRTLT